MEEMPDVIGFPLDEALNKWKASGCEADIQITRPVKATSEGPLRVVRFNRISRDKGVLTVVCEDIGRGGGC